MKETLITPISERDTQESYVYNNPLMWTVQKFYWRANQDHLKRYAWIQNSVKDVVIESDGDANIPFCWDFINKVVIKILAIPEESYEASSIIPWEKYWKMCRIVEPDFVWGISLMEFANKNEDDEDLMYLLYYIERCVETIFRSMWIFWAEFIQENAKITNLEDGELEITVTDIAWNTPHMIRLTEDKLYFYRYLVLSIAYSYLLRLWQMIGARIKWNK